MWRIIGFKGGGGGSTEQHSTIPDEWKPFITRQLASAEDAKEAGKLAQVAGLTGEQEQALQRQAGSAAGYDRAAEELQQTRQDLLDTSALKDRVGAEAQEALATQRSNAALGGRLGSARQQALESKAETDLARSFADIDYQAKKDFASTAGAEQKLIDAGTAALGEAGKTRQAQSQAEADAEYQALNRIFGLYGSAPFQSQQTVQKGGGK